MGGGATAPASVIDVSSYKSAGSATAWAAGRDDPDAGRDRGCGVLRRVEKAAGSTANGLQARFIGYDYTHVIPGKLACFRPELAPDWHPAKKKPAASGWWRTGAYRPALITLHRKIAANGRSRTQAIRTCCQGFVHYRQLQPAASTHLAGLLVASPQGQGCSRADEVHREASRGRQRDR
jgi:hypothetical protein